MILGATHPDVLRDQGEAYRTSLAARAAKLRVTKHVRFVDEFVGRNVLTRWLQAATVFVTSTPDLDTMLSGPLSYAMTTGRAIVSTPYPYATELLGEDRGVMVPRRPRPSPPGSITSPTTPPAGSRWASGPTITPGRWPGGGSEGLRGDARSGRERRLDRRRGRHRRSQPSSGRGSLAPLRLDAV